MVLVSAPPNTDRPTMGTPATGSLDASGDAPAGALAALSEGGATSSALLGTAPPSPVRDRAGAPADRAVRRGRKVIGETLAVLAMVIGSVLLVPRPNSVPLEAVDVASSASAAAPRLGFTPSVPGGLDDWTPTIAVLRRGATGILTWHVGYVTAQGRYAGIDQAARWSFTWQNTLDSGGTPEPAVVIDGRTWMHLEKAERVTTTLIYRQPGRVTLVTSKGGGLAEAETLIRSLPADSLSGPDIVPDARRAW